VGVAHGGVRPDLVLPDEPSVKAGDLTTAFPQLRFVDALLTLFDRVVPSRGQKVIGHLQPATAEGVGASILFASAGGNIQSQVTLREADYGPSPKGSGPPQPDDYAVLLPPATYWLLNEIGGPEALSPNWRAHALFASGARLQEANDMTRARQLYEEALQYSPPLSDVLINLGGIEIKAGASASPPDLDQISRGIHRLLQALGNA
jgi:hypothetical protein